MKKALLGVLAGILVLVVVLLVVIATRPDEFVVTRSATVNAAPDAVYRLVNDFHAWNEWSPWAKLDPNMKVTYSGPPYGTGASYAWTGNDQVGEGNMTIVESKRDELVKIDLRFIKPFASSSITQFTLQPNGGQTTVTWTMNGQHTFISKAMCLIMDMDKMIGPDFERGLAQLKPLAETPRVQHVDVN